MSAAYAQLQADLDSLQVQTRKEWLPGAYGPGSTACNFAAKGACDKRGVELPAKLANDLQVWLAGDEGRAAGWAECDAETAGRQALLGIDTLSTLHEEGHGHITYVRDVDPLTRGLVIWQAGRQNFNRAPIRSAYTSEQLTQVRYFTRSTGATHG